MVRITSHESLPSIHGNIIVRGTTWSPLLREAAIETSKEGLPISRNVDDIGQFAEWTYMDNLDRYEAVFQITSTDEKIYLYGFVDMNKNNRLDAGEPYGILEQQPRTVRKCRMLNLRITIDLNNRYTGITRW